MGLAPEDLAAQVGAPFTQDEIDGAVLTVRNAARWHIAPEVSEIITLDVRWGETYFRLPTRYLVSVDSVYDTYRSATIDSSHYRTSFELAKVHRRGGCGWPHGIGRLQVAIHHGYSDVPLDLLPVFAEAARASRRDQSATQFGAGPFRVAYGGQTVDTRTVDPLSTAAVLERYSLFQIGFA